MDQLATGWFVDLIQTQIGEFVEVVITFTYPNHATDGPEMNILPLTARA